jgi:hypothetical protein
MEKNCFIGFKGDKKIKVAIKEFAKTKNLSITNLLKRALADYINNDWKKEAE